MQSILYVVLHTLVSSLYSFIVDSVVIKDTIIAALYLLTLVLWASHVHVVCSAFTGML